MSDNIMERTVLKGVIMGQAVADLPDPLENRPEPAQGNDELLAQLAGDEIDRLLADDGDSPDAKFSSGRPMDDPEAAPPVPADGDVGNFLHNLNQGHRPPTPAAPAPLPSDSVESPLPAETPETDAAERAALDIHVLNDAIDADPATRPPPLILRPLIWLNAPLDFLPPGIRAGVGKVALITCFNAVAILAYVLLLRRH
jgi:hypothetical protein